MKMLETGPVSKPAENVSTYWRLPLATHRSPGTDGDRGPGRENTTRMRRETRLDTRMRECSRWNRQVVVRFSINGYYIRDTHMIILKVFD